MTGRLSLTNESDEGPAGDIRAVALLFWSQFPLACSRTMNRFGEFGVGSRFGESDGSSPPANSPFSLCTDGFFSMRRAVGPESSVA
jgi:hypothetical protein